MKKKELNLTTNVSLSEFINCGMYLVIPPGTPPPKKKTKAIPKAKAAGA